jgi:hypothetical protein
VLILRAHACIRFLSAAVSFGLMPYGWNRLVRQSVYCSERLGEPRLVEAGIVIRGQVQQLVLCVPATGQDGVHVDVVSYFCTSEQGTDLVGHGIISVQYRPDRQADWFVLSPIQAQFDLRAFGSRPDLKAREGCASQYDPAASSATRASRS